MKKISIATLALAVMFIAANSYACGNQSKADVNKSKAENHLSGAQGQMSSSDACQTDAKAAATKSAGEAKVITTEYKADNKDNCPGATTSMAGNCCAAKAGDASTSKTKAASTKSKNKQTVMVPDESKDLSQANQK
jgi:hypothetical protein